MPYVESATRLGIVSGDDNGNFNPTANITRAEMAVMMNKTYDLLTNDLANTGEITQIVNHDGNYYDIDVKMDNGERNKLTISDDNISIYNKDGSKEMPISSLTKGDKVSRYSTAWLSQRFICWMKKHPHRKNMTRLVRITP